MVRRVLAGVVVALMVSLGVAVPAVASPEPRLTGRFVTETGAPLARVKMNVIYSFGDGIDARTDPSGRFSVSLAEASTGEIDVGVHIGKHDEYFLVAVRQGKSKALGNIVFSSHSTLTGSLDKTPKDESNSVQLYNHDGDLVAYQWIRGGAKSFAFSWGTPGRYTVRVDHASSPGWSYLGTTGEFERARFISLSASSHRSVSLSFSKSPRGAVSGIATSIGMPEAGSTAAFTVVRVGAPAQDAAAVYGDEKGRFSASGLAPGTYRVTRYYSQRTSLKNEMGASRFTVVAGKTTQLGTFAMPASYFAQGWGE